MEQQQIQFDNGAEYEEFMGAWSGLAGDVFLDWLAPVVALRWVDVGCGNGAFSERLVARCAPRDVQGIDPSAEQIAFAQARLEPGRAGFRWGDAMALPYADAAFDAAVMALVLFFVPDPARGVAEMARVVGPGGSVSAYTWDMVGGGFPFAAVHEAMAALGTPPLWPPRHEASRLDVMETLWRDAGLGEVETRVIDVRRTFTDFDTYWRIARTGPGISPGIAGMAPAQREALIVRLRERLVADADGRITVGARANAIRGRVPE